MAAYLEDDSGNKSSNRLAVAAIITAVLLVWVLASLCHKVAVTGGAALWSPQLAEIPESVLYLVLIAFVGKFGNTVFAEKLDLLLSIVQQIKSKKESA